VKLKGEISKVRIYSHVSRLPFHDLIPYLE